MGMAYIYTKLIGKCFFPKIFLILGVLGNVATFLVIMRNEYMGTTTNIYLFNLAVTDLAKLLFAMRSELYLMWRQYPWNFGEVGSLEFEVV
jgi:neuromedin U receptor 2